MEVGSISLFIVVTTKEEIGPVSFFCRTLLLRLVINSLIGSVFCLALPLIAQYYIVNSDWGAATIDRAFEVSDTVLRNVLTTIGPLVLFLIPLVIAFVVLSSIMTIWTSGGAVILILLGTVILPALLTTFFVDFILKKAELVQLVRRNYLSETLFQLKKIGVFLLNIVFGCLIVFFGMLPLWFGCQDCDLVIKILDLYYTDTHAFMVLSMKAVTVSSFFAIGLQNFYVTFSDALAVPRPEILSPAQQRVRYENSRRAYEDTEMENVIIRETEEFEDAVKMQEQREKLMKYIEGASA